MKPERDIKNLVRELDMHIDPRVDRRILDRTLGRLKEATDNPSVALRPMIWRRTMRSPIAKLAVAAALLLATLLGLHFFAGTSHVAWASVLEKVKGIDTYVYRVREIETTGPRPESFEFVTEKETTVYQSPSEGLLREKYWNGELFARYCWSRRRNEYLGICYPLEEYERLPLREDWNDSSSDPRRMIVQVLEGPYAPLGRTEIAGRIAEGVQTDDPNLFSWYVPKEAERFTAQVWTDVETELPVWVEIGFTSEGSELQTTVVIDRFQWDVTLDPDLFEPEVPADFAFDYTDKPRPDSVPRTDQAEAFAENTQSEPYLSDFDHVPLLDVNELTLLGVAPRATKPALRVTSADELWEAQDQSMAAWPPYDQVKETLHQELVEQLAVNQLGVENLIAAGIALRERFWAVGGCLSEISYPYAYAGRMVTEMAHERVPENMAVTDQLVESIMTTEVGWIHHVDPNERINNRTYPGLLTELRMQQFEQIQGMVAQGHVPTWKDYVRVSDLILLLSARWSRDYDGAVEPTRWLIAQTETAGWTYYLATLTKMEQAYASGEGYVPGLFLDPIEAFPEEYRYARRLFSFQGPRERSSQLLPMHLRHLKGW